MKTTLTLMLIAAVAALGACSGKDNAATTAPAAETAANAAAGPELAKPDSPVLAKVGGTPITRAMLNAYLDARGVEKANAQQKRTALDDLISLVLLKHEAQRTGLTDNPEFQVKLHLERLNSVASTMARKYAMEHPVTEADARARYEQSVTRAGKQEYKISHILLKTRDAALAVIEQLNQGADFAALANKKSIDNRNDAGGSLGWVNLTQLPQPLAEKVKATEVGTYSQKPVQTRYGWHIVRVQDTRSFRPPSFDQVKGGIVAALQRKRTQQYVASLRREADVRIMTVFAAPEQPASAGSGAP